MEALLALRRPFYVLESERIGDDVDDEGSEMTLAPDASYLGGSPGLPPRFDWPYAGDVPLVFVGQINLADLPPLPGPDADLLPREGVLSLFLFDDYPVPAPLRGSGLVLYLADSTTLVTTTPAHEPRGTTLPLLALSASVAPPTLPGWEQPFYPLLLDTFQDGERDPYGKAADLMRDVLLGDDGLVLGEDDVKHQLLGYPYVLQSDALAEAAMDESHEAGEEPLAPTSRAFAERAAGWRLLWQVDSEDDFLLGDGGVLQVLMREGDLRARRFDRARIVWQMH